MKRLHVITPVNILVVKSNFPLNPNFESSLSNWTSWTSWVLSPLECWKGRFDMKTQFQKLVSRDSLDLNSSLYSLLCHPFKGLIVVLCFYGTACTVENTANKEMFVYFCFRRDDRPIYFVVVPLYLCSLLYSVMHSDPIIFF